MLPNQLALVLTILRLQDERLLVVAELDIAIVEKGIKVFVTDFYASTWQPRMVYLNLAHQAQAAGAVVWKGGQGEADRMWRFGSERRSKVRVSKTLVPALGRRSDWLSQRAPLMAKHRPLGLL